MEFFLKYKKIFLLIGFLLLVIILGYLIYALFFKIPPVEQPPAETTTTTPAGLPSAGEGGVQIIPPEGEGGLPTLPGEEITPQGSTKAQGGLTQTEALIETPSTGATMGKDGQTVQYYNEDDGKFYRISPDGKISALSDKIFHEVENIVWSPSKEKAILEYPDGSNIVYNFKTQKQTTLPKHWEDFDFSPDSNQIVMKSMGLDPENRWLAVTNDDGSKTRPLERLGTNDETVYPSWSPNNRIVAMYTEGVDFDRQKVFFVGLNNENYKYALIEGRGFEYQWSPKGDKLLYSVYSSQNDLKPNLWIVNSQGESIGSERANLSIETWAEKCTFMNDSELICGVPETLPEGAGLFKELALETNDNLYKININTGLKKMIAIPDQNVNISNPIVSDNGYHLYFTDQTTQKIYNINLK